MKIIGWCLNKNIKVAITPNWEDYDIVHQFNRIPEIHNKIKDIYEK